MVQPFDKSHMHGGSGGTVLRADAVVVALGICGHSEGLSGGGMVAAMFVLRVAVVVTVVRRVVLAERDA
ncbi:hypothetical protein LCL61_28015 [Amycolatopsis coloradensis]|uniref:Uncharacterized protein n=1 Tax=Amycolatopsis coloradensis TaxID=76021 RepID=A0ACD5BIY9_9PSEU